MSQLWSTIRWDWRLQQRQGIFVAALVVLLICIGLFSQLDDVLAYYLVPVVLYIDLSVFGFFFMAGLLYLEKGEGVLSALAVTPLRSWHYLVAKVTTLTTISLLISLAVVALVYHQPVRWPVLCGGLVLNSIFFTLVSFVLAVRYDAINEFIIPSIGVLGLAQIPFFDSFGIWQGWPLYLLPFQAALLLVRGAFEPLATWQWIYALLYIGFCIGAGFLWSLHLFERFVVRGTGETA